MISARRCPRCRIDYAEPELLFCPSHGLRLGQEVESARDPFLGRSLGKFAVQRRLGEGAMGVVYLAIQDVIERPVALKVLKPHLSSDPAMRALFVREVRLASCLRHESAVEVYDFGQDDEVAFFAMEYLSGETLAARLQRQGPLPLREALDLWVKLLEVMSEAHESGITHCDLKPDNLFLEPVGERLRPKVLDFGIARLRKDEEGPLRRSNRSHLAGTPLYMAPEQLQGAAPMPGWDVYALGLILFQMLAGRLPFDVGVVSVSHEQETELQGDQPAPGLWDLAEQRLFRDAQRLNAVCPGLCVSPALVQLIAAALERDPTRRPGSAKELLAQVQRLEAQREDWMVAEPSWPAALRRARGSAGWRSAALLVSAAVLWLVLPVHRAPSVAPSVAPPVAPVVMAPSSTPSAAPVPTRSTKDAADVSPPSEHPPMPAEPRRSPPRTIQRVEARSALGPSRTKDPLIVTPKAAPVTDKDRDVLREGNLFEGSQKEPGGKP